MAGVATELKFLWAALAGVLLMLVLHYWRGFPWNLALIVGIGGAALVYWTFRAVENLRRL